MFRTIDISIVVLLGISTEGLKERVRRLAGISV
jgi:hypothetical protein